MAPFTRVGGVFVCLHSASAQYAESIRFHLELNRKFYVFRRIRLTGALYAGKILRIQKLHSEFLSREVEGLAL